MPAHRKNFDTAIELYHSGLSLADVALALGKSRQAVYAALKRRGITLRAQLKFGPDNHFYRDGAESDERVHLIVTKAIQRGRLIPRPCEVCGLTGTNADGRNKVHAHHDDYNKPLSVRWLCDDHHREWHKANKPIRRTVEIPPMPHKKIASMGGKTTWKKDPQKASEQLAAAREARRKKRDADSTIRK